MTLENEFQQLSSGITRIRQQYAYLSERGEAMTARLAVIEKEKATLVKAVALIDRAIEAISASGIGKIETLVTGGLRIAFSDPDYAFKIAKKTGARGSSFELQIWHGEITGPTFETFGGGVWNITSFLLRLILIERFKLARVMIVDETFNNVSPQYVPMLSRLLRDLTRKQGFTVFAVTHQRLLAAGADRVYILKPQKGAPPKLHLFEGDKNDLADHFGDEGER